MNVIAPPSGKPAARGLHQTPFRIGAVREAQLEAVLGDIDAWHANHPDAAADRELRLRHAVLADFVSDHRETILAALRAFHGGAA